ncbi:MAG: type II toxin-antitoxin system Phd/YefM family antitoxin [Parcubacteria group bacterium]|nr:type II toxin-antitoxin system Phd/YefM family antitoxin [Parcubacteria group bacterium]
MLINSTMTTTIPLTKARVNLGSIVKRVHLKKERFILEKDGYPVAALIDLDEYEDYLDSQDESLKKQIRESRAEFDAGKGRSFDKFLSRMKEKYGV